MFLFYSNKVLEDNIILTESEAHHAVNVLRHNIGDELHITNGEGKLFSTEIIEKSKSKVICKICKSCEKDNSAQGIFLAFSPVKSRERNQFLLEKATEIGVEKIFVFYSQNSERTAIKLDKWNQYLIAAMKQSKRLYVPKIEEISLNELLQLNCQNKLFAHCNENYNRQKGSHLLSNLNIDEILCAIGPEGDFSPEEINKLLTNNYQAISFGQEILRTETAALYFLSTVKYLKSL